MKMEFIKLSKKNIEVFSNDEKNQLCYVMDSIFMDIADTEKVDELLDYWHDETQIEVIDEVFSNEFLGIHPEKVLSDKDYELFYKATELAFSESEETANVIENLQKIWGNIPFLGVLNLISSENDIETYKSKLDKQMIIFPDYPYFILSKYMLSLQKFEKTRPPSLLLSDVFKNNNKISDMEFNKFIEVKTLGIIYNNDINEIEALYSHIEDLELDEKKFNLLRNLLIFARYKYLREYFDLN